MYVSIIYFILNNPKKILNDAMFNTPQYDNILHSIFLLKLGNE